MLRNFLGLIKIDIIGVLYNEIKIEVKIKANQNLRQVCKICRHERDLIFFLISHCLSLISLTEVPIPFCLNRVPVWQDFFHSGQK
jgi:hypothetical protein